MTAETIPATQNVAYGQVPPGTDDCYDYVSMNANNGTVMLLHIYGHIATNINISALFNW